MWYNKNVKLKSQNVKLQLKMQNVLKFNNFKFCIVIFNFDFYILHYMATNSFIFYSVKILAELVRDVLYFPLWWYSRGLINLLLGGICTEYVVEFWSSYFKEVAVDVSFWPCALAGLFLGEITIPLALFTYIMSFVL